MTESIEVKSEEQPAQATEQDVEPEATESTEPLKQSADAEPTNELEEELEQTTGLSSYTQHAYSVKCSSLFTPLIRQDGYYTHRKKTKKL